METNVGAVLTKDGNILSNTPLGVAILESSVNLLNTTFTANQTITAIKDLELDRIQAQRWSHIAIGSLSLVLSAAIIGRILYESWSAIKFDPSLKKR